jgi:RimJ/RimL family protein N-acetyltransferase
MFTKSLFRGSLVRLAANSPENQAKFAEWSNNDEYLRLADGDPAFPVAPQPDEKTPQPDPSQLQNSYGFSLRTLEDDTLIGGAGLFNIRWKDRACGLGIVIGDPAYWGKGYGSDAMALLVGYAFRELNLYRVELDVLSYNARAIRCYEKAGFVLEGTQRGAICREGQRFDVLNYGILYDEWQARQDGS